MLPDMKKLILAFIIVLGGVLIGRLYFKYGIAVGITPAIMILTIYVWWQILKRKIPENRYPELSDSDKERIKNNPEIEKLLKELGLPGIRDKNDK